MSMFSLIGAGVGLLTSLIGSGQKDKASKQAAEAQRLASEFYGKQAEWFEDLALWEYASALLEAGTADYNAGQARYEADMLLQIGQFNFIAAEMDAVNVRRRAGWEAHELRKKGSRVVGQAVANYGKSGVVMVGTPMEVIGESIEAVQNDVLHALEAGEMAASKATMQGQIDMMRAMVESNRASSRAGLQEMLALQIRTGAPYKYRGTMMLAEEARYKAKGAALQAEATTASGTASLLGNIGGTAGKFIGSDTFSSVFSGGSGFAGTASELSEALIF